MTDPTQTPTSASLDQALAAAVERYRERNPASARAVRTGRRGAARRQHAQRAVPVALPAGHGARRRLLAVGRRRSPLLLDALGEFTAGLYGHSAAPIRDAIVAALDGGISLSSHTLREVELARELVRALPFDAAAALHQQRHRSQPAGAGHGRGPHRTAQGAGLRRRLPRRRAVLRRRGRLGERAARLAARALQRPGRRGRACAARRRRRSPRSWSSRCSARAAAFPARRSSCRACAGWPTTAARCWSSTR